MSSFNIQQAVTKQSAKLQYAFGVLALLAVLLCAQVASLQHGSEHVFHEDQELCSLFVALEKSHVQPLSIVMPAVTITAVNEPSFKSFLLAKQHLRNGLSRAPPISFS